MKLHTYIIGALLALTTTATAQERLVTLSPQPLNMAAAASRQSASLAAAPSRVLADSEGLLGYTDSANPDSITISGAYFGTAGTYTVGAWLTSDLLTNYVGCKVVGLRFAVSQSIGSTTGYLFKVTDNQAESLVSKTLRRTAEGWNEIRFNSSQEHTIEAGEGLIYCYDYNESADMVAAQEGALCTYGTHATSSYATLYYTGTQFQGLSGVGNLCIQLIVDVTSLPTKNLDADALLAGNKYKKQGEEIDAFLQFSNTGKEPITSCRWGYQVDNGYVTYVSVDKTMTAGSSNSFEAVFSLPADIAVGAHEMRFFVDQIDGAAPEKADTIVDKFVVYQNALPRQEVYVEQYTSADSYYVPSIDAQTDALDGTNSICLVNVHQSGTPLAVDDAAYLDALYAYTWPCFTVNRFYFFGEQNIAFDANDYVFLLPSLIGDAVKEIATEAKNIPAFASIELAPTYDAATRTLSLTVSGDVSADAEALFGDLALTVLLAEDGVNSPQLTVNTTTGATSTNKNYLHNEVLRGYATAPLGTRLSVVDGRYTVTVSRQLDAAWNADNIKVVALVTKAADTVTDANVLDMDVTNAASVRLKDVINGIEEAPAANTTAQKEYYTLDGVRVSASQLHKGIYVVRQGASTQKMLVR